MRLPQPHGRSAKYRRDISGPEIPKNYANKWILQVRVLYMVRFASTGDICNAWLYFGCIASQFPVLGISLRLAITETAAFRIAFDTELREMARWLYPKRDSKVDFATAISARIDDIVRYFKKELGNEAE